MLLDLRKVSVHYDKVEVLNDISIELEEGQTVTLIGANGAGKTTTLRTISGLKKPTTGEIWFDGNNISRTSPQEIVEFGIAHVPEGRRVFATMTVQENLLLGAFFRKNRSAIRSDLEKQYQHFPRLKERRNQRAGSLSGGEQQMLAIARALMARPRLMMLDEPTMGLAPVMVDLVEDIVKEIHREGVSVLLVEQNARVALRLADKGYVMETGNIVLNGATAEIGDNEHVKQAYLGG